MNSTLRHFPGIRTRLWALCTKRPLGSLYYVGGGLGDELMLTAVAHAARKAGRPLNILSDWPDVWRGNTDIVSLHTGVERWFYARLRGWIPSSVEIRHLTTSNHAPLHLARQQAGNLDLTLEDDWAPRFTYPTRPHSRRRITFQLSCRGARYAATTKEWAHDRWLNLLARLGTDHELIQLGTSQDPLVPGVVDLRGRTTLAEAASWIASSGLFLGLESGLMHLAAATGVPAVIIFGGRTSPALTGYCWHTQLVRTPSCTGCALNNNCPNNLICLDIPVDEVEAAVRTRLHPR
jgi:hypothetical protein